MNKVRWEVSGWHGDCAIFSLYLLVTRRKSLLARTRNVLFLSEKLVHASKGECSVTVYFGHHVTSYVAWFADVRWPVALSILAPGQ
jgi:hypothetical protein